MKKNLEDLNIPVADQKLIRDVLKTRCTPAATAFVKAAIFRREQLMDRSPDAPVFKLEKIKESKSRKRAASMVDAILALTERKSVSVLCGAAISVRRLCRARAKKA